jgi:hypothetical protein
MNTVGTSAEHLTNILDFCSVKLVTQNGTYRLRYFRDRQCKGDRGTVKMRWMKVICCSLTEGVGQ